MNVYFSLSVVGSQSEVRADSKGSVSTTGESKAGGRVASGNTIQSEAEFSAGVDDDNGKMEAQSPANAGVKYGPERAPSSRSGRNGLFGLGILGILYKLSLCSSC